MKKLIVILVIFSFLGCEKVEYIYVIPDVAIDSLGEVDALSDSSETSDAIEVEVGEDVVEEADVEVEAVDDVVEEVDVGEEDVGEEEGCGDTMSDPLNCGECGHICPPDWACCAGACRDIMGSDEENCGECGNVCVDEGCSNSFCIDGRCILFSDDSNCPEGYSCMGPDCIQRCTYDFECNDNDRCNGEETCVGGLCSMGIPMDCSDLYSRTVDGCYEWNGGVVSNPDPCCHICDVGIDDCNTRLAVWDSGASRIIDPGSFEGVYKFVDTSDVMVGACSVTHLEFFWEEGRLKMALIEEGWGYLKNPEDFMTCWISSAMHFQFQEDFRLVINGGFANPGPENVLLNLEMRVSGGYWPTTKADCYFHGGMMGNACKVCGVGADIPSYSGCPY